MSFRPQRDKPLPKGLVHGMTSIMFESALMPAEPPKPFDARPSRQGSPNMKTVAEIRQAILELPEADYAQLSRWFHELDWERWDAEIEQSARDGKLDSLVEQAAQAQADGTLQEL